MVILFKCLPTYQLVHSWKVTITCSNILSSLYAESSLILLRGNVNVDRLKSLNVNAILVLDVLTQIIEEFLGNNFSRGCGIF